MHTSRITTALSGVLLVTMGTVNVHWIRAHADPRSNEVFSFAQGIVEENR